MTRVLALAFVATLLGGTSASAEETVATASPADAHPPGAAAPGPLSSATDPAGAAGGDVLMTACGPERVNDQGVVETRPHGEISVGVGTHGAREVGGSVCQPLPGGGFVAVSAGQSRIGR
jgi:hypothetical protein